jgi:hypothetical protein
MHTVAAIYSGSDRYILGSGSLQQRVQYRFSGFLAPLSTDLAYGLGRTIPVKFELSDAHGAFLSSPGAVTSLKVAPVDARGNVGTLFDPASTNGKGLVLDGHDFHLDWQTKGLLAGSYLIQLKLADGTMQTRTIQLTASKGAAGLMADTVGAAGGPLEGSLLAGDLTLAVVDPGHQFTADQQAQITAAIAAIDGVLAPYGVAILMVDPAAGVTPDVTIETGSTSEAGGLGQGVLGCETDTGLVTLIQGWNWYAGSDPGGIGLGQDDFETVVVHELGHTLGLGHSTDAASVMYATLAAGTTRQAMIVADLNVPDVETGPSALHVSVPLAASPAVAANARSRDLGLAALDLALSQWARGSEGAVLRPASGSSIGPASEGLSGGRTPVLSPTPRSLVLDAGPVDAVLGVVKSRRLLIEQ